MLQRRGFFALVCVPLALAVTALGSRRRPTRVCATDAIAKDVESVTVDGIVVENVTLADESRGVVEYLYDPIHYVTEPELGEPRIAFGRVVIHWFDRG